MADRGADSVVFLSGRTDRMNKCTSRIQLSGQKGRIQHPDSSGCESIFSSFCTCIFYHYCTADLYFYGISAEPVCDTASVLQFLHFYADPCNDLSDEGSGCIFP